MTVLIAICVAGVYVVKRLRERVDGDEPTASDLLNEFREMREGGEITPQEFQQIKSVLGKKLQQSLGSKDTEGDG